MAGEVSPFKHQLQALKAAVGAPQSIAVPRHVLTRLAVVLGGRAPVYGISDVSWDNGVAGALVVFTETLIVRAELRGVTAVEDEGWRTPGNQHGEVRVTVLPRSLVARIELRHEGDEPAHVTQGWDDVASNDWPGRAQVFVTVEGLDEPLVMKPPHRDGFSHFVESLISGLEES